MRVNFLSGTAHLRIRIDPPMAHRHRSVYVTLTLPDGTELKGYSSCAPTDPFSRFTGKKLALERLLYGTGNGWLGAWTPLSHPNPHLRRFVPMPLAEREDRAALWAAVLGSKYALVGATAHREVAHA